MKPPLVLAVNGAAGRMGIRLIQMINEAPDLLLGAALERSGHHRLGEDAGMLAGIGHLGIPIEQSLKPDRGAAVVVDFSTPEATLTLTPDCVKHKTALVVGTTGFTPDQKKELEQAASSIALFVASNFSKGVYLLARLTELAARTLGDSADIEIIERHHHFKKDAPSGTALTLAETAAQAIGHREFRHGREGAVGQRPKGEIGLHALRTGDNPGEHTVVFGLMGECLELSHRALNRDAFARGALDAARFLAGKPPGLYSMKDMLG